MAEMDETRQRHTSGERPRRRRKRKKRSVWATVGKVLGTLLLVGLTTGLIMTCFAVVYINRVIVPDAKMDYLGDMSMSLTSTMYYTDENGQNREYLTIASDENRVWRRYEDIPEDLIHATVAIEDKRFYKHHGVDWIRTANGVLKMFTGGSVQGGSTLTQQLIKNLTGENQVTVKRKITEIFRALDFDKRYSKETTLEWYLNFIYFGERCYGIHTASYMYFGKDVSKLSLAQCASLISIPNNPSRYDPYLNKDKELTNDMANRERAKLVLKAMLEQGYIEETEYDAAVLEVDTMEFVQGSDETTANITVYNWYQDQVIDDVIQDLMDTYNWSEEVAAHKVYYGGLSIFTNVDPKVQSVVDSVYSDPENLPHISNSGQPLQSGIVVVDQNGRVVALSGGIGEKTLNRGWNRASHTKRPPGSSIKPLGIYAPAMEMRLLNPNSVVDDVPYDEMNGKPWPVNAYGYYKGLTTMPFALAQSSNAVAVRILGDMVTPEAAYNFLETRFHITSLVRERWIGDKKYSDMNLAPLALGGLTNGVSPYEMAAAYAAFPSMGRYVPPTTYSKVVDADGTTVLLDNTGKGEYVISEGTAYYMNTLLKGVVTNGTATRAKLNGMTVAGKTGTTTDEKDLWFVGYTPYYTAAVWTGYDRQEQMRGVGLPTVELWSKVMSQLHEGLENKDFPLPSDEEVVSAAYCLDSGMRPGEYCALDVRGSRVATGSFLKGDVPTQTCDRHVGLTICTADTLTPPEEDALDGAGVTYRLAGEHCPEETVKTIGVLDYTREGAAGAVSPRDGAVLKSKWDDTEPCTVHNGATTEPLPFDPSDPATWPVDDPNFRIEDSSTWPVTPPTDPPPPTQEPEVTPPEGPGGEDQPSAPPVEDEPFIPAGGQ